MKQPHQNIKLKKKNVVENINACNHCKLKLLTEDLYGFQMHGIWIPNLK